jgi:hypothetical protein
MERRKVRLTLCLVTALGIATAAGAASVDPVNVVELSIGPVFTASRGTADDLVVGGAVQLTRVLSPDRPASVLLVARYRFEPYEHEGWTPFLPPEYEYPSPEPGDPGDGRGQFVEAGVGLRSSTMGSPLRALADFEAGVALIRYVSGEVRGEDSAIYVGWRAGGSWQARQWLQATLTASLRLYLGAQHASAHVALGLGHAF